MGVEQAAEPVEADVNEVLLTGRVSGVPEERELPSGDRVVQLRLVVRRAPVRAGSRRVEGERRHD